LTNPECGVVWKYLIISKWNFVMEIYAAQLHPNKNLDKGLHASIDNNNDVKANVSTSQPHVVESGETKVILSSKALALQNIDKAESDKTYEQKTKEYEIAKQEYQETVNDLPVDYRKMKEVKDRIDEEIKMLKAEVSKIKQSTTLNEDEKEQSISVLEQQIADKVLMTLEIGKEFTQKLKEQERSKQISPESSTAMLKAFNSSPPEIPIKN
jgi:hypothetical protein